MKFSCMRIQIVFISMGLHLTSLWNRGLRQLWNGPFRLHELIWKLEVHVIVCNTNYQWSTYVSSFLAFLEISVWSYSYPTVCSESLRSKLTELISMVNKCIPANNWGLNFAYTQKLHKMVLSRLVLQTARNKSRVDDIKFLHHYKKCASPTWSF